MALLQEKTIENIKRLKNERIEPRKPQRELKCHFCSQVIDQSEDHYICVYHKNAFCYGCMQKRGELERHEFASCKETRFRKKDCIFKLERLDLE